MAAVRDCDFELVDHPPYFDLAPSDYLLSSTMKKKTLGWEALKQYQTYNEVISGAEYFFEEKKKTIQALQHWWKKCVDPSLTSGETMLKNKPHLVKFDHRMIVSLRTLEPTVV